MRLIYGTPEFAACTLRGLRAAGHQIELVLTQPDRKAGRGNKLRPSAVKLAALELGLALYQPATLRDPAVPALLAQCAADAMIVAAYGLILPPDVLAITPLGCINVHASLLPRWRGAAPIQRAVEAGDQQTGITIMQMDAGLDTGPMLLVKSLPIGPQDTGGQLHDRLAKLGSETLVQALAELTGPGLKAQPQPEHGASYAAKLTSADGWLDWSLEPPALLNRVRAFDPVPGNAAALQSDPAARFKIWQVAVAEQASVVGNAQPGEILLANNEIIQVACANGAVNILSLQRAGGRRLTVAQFQSGGAVSAGDRFVKAMLPAK